MTKNKDQLSIELPKRRELSDTECKTMSEMLSKEIERIDTMNDIFEHIHPYFHERKEVYQKILSKLN